MKLVLSLSQLACGLCLAQLPEDGTPGAKGAEHLAADAEIGFTSGITDENAVY